MVASQGLEVVFDISVDPDDGGYVADARGHGIHTQGDSLKELRANILEAVDCHFGDTLEQPARVRLLFIGDTLAE